MASSSEDNTRFGTVDAEDEPILSDSGKPVRRAIADEEQGAALVKYMIDENRDRNTKNARITAKYNSEKPYAQAALTEGGLGWKSNFSSQPLATLIDRIAPRFVRAVNSAKYLSNARMPHHVKDAAKKTDVCRREFTKLLRNRVGWNDFVAEIAQENALFGYTSVVSTNPDDWFPRHFRQDKFFIPAGTKQQSKFCPILVVSEDFLIHELYSQVEDKEAAKSAGWHLNKVYDAINEAMPDSARSKYNEDARKFEDLHRESNLAGSYAKGAKIIKCYHIFATETSGKISHYVYGGEAMKMLFDQEDQFDDMEDVSMFYSFQQATGTLQGSKGVGRTVYALAGIVDRTRNEIVDRFQLSGKIIIQGDVKELTQFKMSVLGQCITIGKQFAVSESKIDAGVEAFSALDAYVMHLMDEIAGNVSPAAAAGQLQGERVTNGQINYVADLQNESKDVKIERFLSQFTAMITHIQRRVERYSGDDKEIKEFRARCLESMEKDELKAWLECPAAETVEDLTEMENQQFVLMAQELTGNPLIDQKKLLTRKITAQADADVAEDLLLPDEDPTVTAEQVRTQTFENMSIQNGQQVPVSPRDNDLVHLKTLMPALEQVSGTVLQNPQAIGIVQLFVQHAQAHLQSAQNKKSPPEPLQPFVEQLQKVEQGLAEFEKQQAAQQPIDPNTAPPGQVPGAPPPVAQ